MKALLETYSLIQIVLNLLLIFSLATGYLWVITKDQNISLIVGGITALFSFYFILYTDKKVQVENHYFKELQKYTTNVTFYLQSGYNVLKALETTKETLDPKIEKDINITINELRKNAEMKTDHFQKYNFSSVDIFHQILQIKYDKGGNTKDLFSNINKSINFEIVKRDELFRRKRYMKHKVMVMMLIVLCMPLLLSLTAHELYDTFLSTGIFGMGLTLAIYSGIVISYFFMEKSVSDLAIQYK